MARILYGVMGNTHGHIMRTRAITSYWKNHEFHFVGGGKVPDAFKDHSVLEVPVLRTVHKKQKVDVFSVMNQIAHRVAEIPKVTRQICQLIEQWQPDIAICDREFFLPLACKKMGLRCVSVNHSHVLLKCKYPVPSSQFISWSLAMANDHLLFNYIPESCIVSFFHPPIKIKRARLFPPVIRTEVEPIQPSQGDHVLVYQTSPTFGALIEALRGLKRPVVVYGFRSEKSTEGNITFKPYDTLSILDDLASCAYAVVNGGHNLISEALYFGKPIMCFPIAVLFEQFINAFHIRELGYGDFSTSKHPTTDLFLQFEKKLPAYEAAIRQGEFNGTQKLVDFLDLVVAGQSV